MKYVGVIVIKLCQCALLFLLLAGPNASGASETADDFIATNWRNEDGLPHSIINAVVQGQDGYLWIGTYVGLVRFDGVRFLHYTPADIPELGDGRIVTLFVDRTGTLWIAVEGGRLVAYKAGQARVHIPGGETNSQPIVALAQDATATIWFQNAAGDFGKLTDTSYEIVSRPGGGMARSSRVLFCDQTGHLWVGTAEGMKSWRDGQLQTPAAWPADLRGVVDSAFPCHDGTLLIFRDHKLWRCSGTNVPSLIDTPAGVGNAVNLLEDAAGRIWLGGSSDLYCRTAAGNWRALPRAALPGASRVLCEDREGNIWRGSFGGGLARIRQRPFTMHNLDEASHDAYSRSVCADRAGNLWAVMSSESLARKAVSASDFEELSITNPPMGYRAIFADHKDDIWVGTVGSSLFYQWRNGQLEPVRMPGPRADAVNAIYEDSHHNLWLGYLGGSGVGFMPDGDAAKLRDFEGVPRNDVRAIIEAADGAMWFGTHYGGACRWKDGQWIQFTTRDGLPSDYVRCFLVDSERTLWLGTLRGLCRWREGKFVSITAQDGLWNDSLSHLVEDGSGNIWMSSFRGVFRVSRQMLNEFADGKRDSVQSVGYGRQDGLASVECPGACQPAGAMTPDGGLWFPTVSGMASVTPKLLKENKSLPPVWIEELGVDGKLTTIDPANPTITIPPGKRRFDFRFTALSLAAPEKVLFRHKLAGLDLDWSPADLRRTATYSYLPPGEYTFELVACNNDGIWNENGHALHLVVQPFFWQTWWFKTGVGGLFALCLVLGVRQIERWRAQIQIERVEQKHAIEHERSRIAKDIHDDLGANLTQIIFLSQRAEGSIHDSGETKHWLQKIPATARQTILSLNEIVWAINPKHDTLESLANYISRFALEHLRLAGMRCRLEIPTVLPEAILGAEVRHNIALAVREALQNVAAHSAATEAGVTMQLTEKKLMVVIQDNGRGFDSSQRSGAGNGLNNMQRRVEEMGGRFELETHPGRGTKIQFEFPWPRLARRAGDGLR